MKNKRFHGQYTLESLAKYMVKMTMAVIENRDNDLHGFITVTKVKDHYDKLWQYYGTADHKILREARSELIKREIIICVRGSKIPGFKEKFPKNSRPMKFIRLNNFKKAEKFILDYHVEYENILRELNQDSIHPFPLNYSVSKTGWSECMKEVINASKKEINNQTEGWFLYYFNDHFCALNNSVNYYVAKRELLERGIIEESQLKYLGENVLQGFIVKRKTRLAIRLKDIKLADQVLAEFAKEGDKKLINNEENVRVFKEFIACFGSAHRIMSEELDRKQTSEILHGIRAVFREMMLENHVDKTELERIVKEKDEALEKLNRRRKQDLESCLKIQEKLKAEISQMQKKITEYESILAQRPIVELTPELERQVKEIIKSNV